MKLLQGKPGHNITPWKLWLLLFASFCSVGSGKWKLGQGIPCPHWWTADLNPPNLLGIMATALNSAVETAPQLPGLLEIAVSVASHEKLQNTTSWEPAEQLPKCL